MSKKPDPTSSLMEAILKGFEQVNAEIETQKKARRTLERATYKGLTTSGKSRYASAMVEAYGSRDEVAEILGVTRERVGQLINSDKNRENGK